MKELSIEEKVKRYDEAIKKAKYYYDEGKTLEYANDIVSSIFPELKENEDERIRKAILALVKQSSEILEKKNQEQMIAWLEKQGEQKPAENKDYSAPLDIEIPFDAKDSELIQETIRIPDGCYAFIEGDEIVIKKGKKPAEWSEKDEVALSDALWCCKQAASTAKDENDMGNVWYAEHWLKSLKDRVQPQPKQEWKQENTGDLNDFENAMMHIANSFFGQYAGLDPNDTNAIREQANLLLELAPNKEWSEEDEKMFNSALWHVKNSCSNGGKNSGEFEVYNWLKSLRPQNRWKPSDEQMGALANACDGKILNLDYLNSLYQDLKKLKKGE